MITCTNCGRRTTYTRAGSKYRASLKLCRQCYAQYKYRWNRTYDIYTDELIIPDCNIGAINRAQYDYNGDLLDEQL